MTLNEILQAARPGVTFRLSSVDVLGPYPTRSFFEQIASETPERVFVAVEQGWPQSYMDEIDDALVGLDMAYSSVRVAPMWGNGLVHAKAYLFEWTNQSATKTKRRLVVGSANASSQGFAKDGQGHAETYVVFELTGEDARIARDYFGRLREGGDEDVVDGVWIGQGTSARAWLPPLKLTSARPASFGAWLRRGRLCHRYERDQLFGKLLLSLKKPLPPGPLDAAFGEAGLASPGSKVIFGAAYVAGDTGLMHMPEPRWRGSYFVETTYGHWTSEECFCDRQKTFVGKGHKERQAVIEKVARMSREDERGHVDGFLARLHRAADALRAAGESPKEYFDCCDGTIDEPSYRERALNKLNQDKQQAKDPAFSARFVSGYAFPSVPRLDGDFFDFASSFCESVQLKLARSRNHSKIARALHSALEREAPGEFVEAESPADLFRLIELTWSRIEPEMSSFDAAADER